MWVLLYVWVGKSVGASWSGSESRPQRAGMAHWSRPKPSALWHLNTPSVQKKTHSLLELCLTHSQILIGLLEDQACRLGLIRAVRCLIELDTHSHSATRPGKRGHLQQPTDVTVHGSAPLTPIQVPGSVRAMDPPMDPLRHVGSANPLPSPEFTFSLPYWCLFISPWVTHRSSGQGLAYLRVAGGQTPAEVQRWGQEAAVPPS